MNTPNWKHNSGKSKRTKGMCKGQIVARKQALSKDFVLEFADIGWRFIDLKNEGLISNNGKKGAKCQWFAAQ